VSHKTCQLQNSVLIPNQKRMLGVVDQVLARGGRVLRILTEKPGRGPAIDLWFVMGIDDSDQAARAVTHSSLPEAKIEVVAVFAPDVPARWKLQDGEVRPPVPSP